MLSKDELEAYSKEYYLIIFKYCYKRLNDKEDAEDATQDTFMIFNQKGHIIDKEHVAAWLFATAHNIILREYKKRYLNKENVCPFDEEMEALSHKVRTIEDDMVNYYTERYIDEIYSRLSDKEKEFFDLFSDCTLKTGQIAQMMGMDPHACSMRKKRLKEKCKDIMLEILFY